MFANIMWRKKEKYALILSVGLEKNSKILDDGDDAKISHQLAAIQQSLAKEIENFWWIA